MNPGAQSPLPPQGPPSQDISQWECGYRVAIADALAVVDAVGGTSFQNLSGPVLRRLRARLAEIERGRASRAA
ncbi:MAG: hypothetical protein HS107_08230 [Thermoflexaceae bacterium]|nr:hypothetical protein [Thermoflexaceae bacterium]